MNQQVFEDILIKFNLILMKHFKLNKLYFIVLQIQRKLKKSDQMQRLIILELQNYFLGISNLRDLYLKKQLKLLPKIIKIRKKKKVSFFRNKIQDIKLSRKKYTNNPFLEIAPILHPLKIPKKTRFQRLSNGDIGQKWFIDKDRQNVLNLRLIGKKQTRRLTLIHSKRILKIMQLKYTAVQ